MLGITKCYYLTRVRILTILMLLSGLVQAQIQLDSTLLPIILINTSGVAIVDEPKISATMGIIDNGPGLYNRATDIYNDYDGNIGIELRGSTSQFLFDKKSYGIELWTSTLQDTSASILGFPREEDWVFNGPYSDKSLMRNVITFDLWNKTGRYGSRTRFFELVINNDYKGVYVLMEKVKRDSSRVNISKLTELENSGDDLTGGYIVKLDKFDGSNSGQGWISPYRPRNYVSDDQVVFFQFDYPKGSNITPQQRQYIEGYVTGFEEALFSSNYRDIQTGYRAYIYDDSFIDFAIMNEVTRNVDGYRLSTFLHKDKDSQGGKLTIGPIWDFNLAIGNADYCNGSDITGWAWDFNTVCRQDFWLIPFWWKRMLSDPGFVSSLQTRWLELRNGPFATDQIMQLVDSVSQLLEKPQQRNYQRWNIMGQYVWPNNFVGQNYQEEVQYLKDWLDQRLQWLDNNFAALEVVTALKINNEIPSVSIFPNPFSTNIHINHTEGIKGISLYNNLGHLIKHIENINREKAFELNVINLPNGLYFIELEGRNNQKHTLKIIKN